MRGRAAVSLALAAVTLGVSARASAGALTMEEAVAVALQRNREVIAAKLEIDAATLDVVAARVYPNPTFAYGLGNLVLGQSNPQVPLDVQAGFLGQTVQSFGVSEIVDVWAKRSAHVRAANEGVAHRRILVEDALRDIVFGVRSAFAEVVREQSERQLAHDFADRYSQTIRISQARFKAGDISEAELRKIRARGAEIPERHHRGGHGARHLARQAGRALGAPLGA